MDLFFTLVIFDKSISCLLINFLSSLYRCGVTFLRYPKMVMPICQCALLLCIGVYFMYNLRFGKIMSLI